MSNVIVPLLQITPLDQESGLQAVWSSVRNVADVFFIPNIYGHYIRQCILDWR